MSTRQAGPDSNACNNIFVAALNDSNTSPTLDEVRDAIDALDASVVGLLAEREQLVRTASALKSSASEVAAPNRAEHVISRAADLAADKGSDPQVVREIYTTLVSSFITLETRARESGR